MTHTLQIQKKKSPNAFVGSNSAKMPHLYKANLVFWLNADSDPDTAFRSLLFSTEFQNKINIKKTVAFLFSFIQIYQSK
jgi:hypothetical protein